MGGKEGGRGYLYQGIAAVLEALKRNDWDQIYVEFPTENDKVDIALKFAGKITDAIQVKSTMNSFGKGEVSNWLLDIISDYSCQRYKLILIGNCAPSAMDFINALGKFQAGKIDETSKRLLESFDNTLLSDIKVEFNVLPFNPDDLKGLAREALLSYAYKAGHSIEYPQASLLVDAMIENQLFQSTKGAYIARTTFMQELYDRSRLIINAHTKTRKKIGILSFSECSAKLKKDVPVLLNLQEKFDGRFLNKCLDWTSDIGKPVQDFLKSNTDSQQSYQIAIEAHSSIAFTAGRIFHTKLGVDICPIQETLSGWDVWEIDPLDQTEYQPWTIEHIAVDDEAFDSVLILNISRIIYSEVEQYLKKEGILTKRIINCTLGTAGGTNFAVQNGTHASKLANAVYASLANRTTVERRASLHIFAAAPNAFMFYLGQISRPFGKCILYEYDFEQRSHCSYIPSICFGGKGGLE